MKKEKHRAQAPRMIARQWYRGERRKGNKQQEKDERQLPSPGPAVVEGRKRDRWRKSAHGGKVTDIKPYLRMA